MTQFSRAAQAATVPATLTAWMAPCTVALKVTLGSTRVARCEDESDAAVGTEVLQVASRFEGLRSLR